MVPTPIKSDKMTFTSTISINVEENISPVIKGDNETVSIYGKSDNEISSTSLNVEANKEIISPVPAQSKLWENSQAPVQVKLWETSQVPMQIKAYPAKSGLRETSQCKLRPLQRR